jgi:hypothetical protein
MIFSGKQVNHFFAFYFSLFLFFGFFSCSRQLLINNEYWENAIQLDKAMTCYNTNSGVSFIIPKRWWLYDLNTANFSPNPDDTVDNAFFDIIYEENLWRMDLVSFANSRFPLKKKYFGFEISLESGKIFNSQGNSVIINGMLFKKHKLSQPLDRTGIISFSTDLKTDCFLNIRVTYWGKNRNAESGIINILEKALIILDTDISDFYPNKALE